MNSGTTSPYALNYVWEVGTLKWVPEVQANPSGGGAVTIADGADVTQGAIADAAVAAGATGTVNAHLRSLSRDLVANVGIASSALPTGAATETTLGTRLSESDFDTKTGSLTEVAPATDTASSGLNGRLQRIAQRLTSLITALGSPFQAGGSIANTTFAATQATATNLKTQAENYQGGTAVGAANPLLVSLANTATNATAVKVDGSAVTQPVSVADGVDVTQGAIADAAVTAGATGSISAKLRSISRDLVSNIVLAAGTAIIGSFKWAGYQNATWTAHHIPSANTQATITQASAGGSLKNVCTGFTVTLAATATAPTAGQITVSLIDGATGGGTYLWRTVISIPAVAGAVVAFHSPGRLWLVGTAATAMTLEFSGAGGANTVESVSMNGTTTL